MRYIKRINGIDIVLLFIAIICLIYCCDLPVWKGFEFWDHTSQPFIYDLCMAVLTAISFHIIQRIYNFYTVTLKCERLVGEECVGVRTSIQRVVYLITKQNDFKGITREYLINLYPTLDFHNQGSGELFHNRELVLIDGIMKINNLMLARIDRLLSMSAIEPELSIALLKIRSATINDYWRMLSENHGGHTETVLSQKGLSAGGLFIGDFSPAQWADAFLEYKELIDAIDAARHNMYGYDKPRKQKTQ